MQPYSPTIPVPPCWRYRGPSCPQENPNSTVARNLTLPRPCSQEDFGGKESPSHGHADPNLTHAVELVKKMGLTKEASAHPVGGPLHLLVSLCPCSPFLHG